MDSLRARINGVIRPQGKLFYGWWIVGASTGVQWLSSVLWMSSYGAYVVTVRGVGYKFAEHLEEAPASK